MSSAQSDIEGLGSWLGGWENSLWKREDLGWIPSNPVRGCIFVTTYACPPSVRVCVGFLEFSAQSTLLKWGVSGWVRDSRFERIRWREVYIILDVLLQPPLTYLHICVHTTHTHTPEQTNNAHINKRCWKWPRWVKSFTRLIYSSQHAVS